ncbi:WD40 repeat domain-containing protein [Streptomyces sp. NPDC002514]|uniref:WD40 repeat domain-containing protein n=1 Tax=Streptomyces sp. NPDC001270 TaxID=3364554 RepID=UPI0036C2668A
MWPSATAGPCTARPVHDRNGTTGPRLSPDGKTVATSTIDGTIRLWNAATGRGEASLKDDLATSVKDLAFSPDGRTLATSADFGLMLWNVADRKPSAVLADSKEQDARRQGGRRLQPERPARRGQRPRRPHGMAVENAVAPLREPSPDPACPSFGRSTGQLS